MQNRTDEERQQRAGIVAAALLFAAFGVLWLLGVGWTDGLALGFGGLCLGFVLAHPTPRILRSEFPLPAARPANGVLSSLGSPTLRHWREALAGYLERETATAARG